MSDQLTQARAALQRIYMMMENDQVPDRWERDLKEIEQGLAQAEMEERSVRIPEDSETAAAMISVGLAWLEANAPHTYRQLSGKQERAMYFVPTLPSHLLKQMADDFQEAARWVSQSHPAPGLARTVLRTRASQCRYAAGAIVAPEAIRVPDGWQLWVDDNGSIRLDDLRNDAHLCLTERDADIRPIHHMIAMVTRFFSEFMARSVGDPAFLPATPTEEMVDAAIRAPLPAVMRDSISEGEKDVFRARYQEAARAYKHFLQTTGPKKPAFGDTHE